MDNPMRFLSLRAVFLLGFVIAMPVLALPPVARRIDALLYGPPPADFGRPPAAAPLNDEVIQPKAAAPLSPPRQDEPSPAAWALAGSPVEAPPTAPSFSPAPRFDLPSTTAPAHAPEPKVDEQTIARLQQIRASLENLGAEYVVVEAQESGRFRFQCRMLVDANSRFTRLFEASSFDPVAAGQQVLRDVESWRSAASGPRTVVR
jgi:hypothetical protein